MAKANIDVISNMKLKNNPEQKTNMVNNSA